MERIADGARRPGRHRSQWSRRSRVTRTRRRSSRLGIGDASQGGTGVYTLTWTSTGGSALKTPVLYDILPYVGDVGVSGGQSAVPRDSEFAPTFAAIIGRAARQTSRSSTRRRPTLAARRCSPTNPSCVNDWSATPPADPATVKALRFASTATYPSGAGVRRVVPGQRAAAVRQRGRLEQRRRRRQRRLQRRGAAARRGPQGRSDGAGAAADADGRDHRLGLVGEPR